MCGYNLANTTSSLVFQIHQDPQTIVAESNETNSRMALALRWIINGARGQKGVPMHKALAQELKLAAKEEGNAVKKKEDTHRMAEANKAFAHFA